MSDTSSNMGAQHQHQQQYDPAKPTAAFVGAAWLALVLGMSAYLIGLFNAEMLMIEKGYYFTLLLFGLFAAVSVQKAVRDRMEGVRVTNIYYGLSWFAVLAALSLTTIGLWNAKMALSEKGFYGMTLVLCLFAAVTVQKNVRDLEAAGGSSSASGGGAEEQRNWFGRGEGDGA